MAREQPRPGQTDAIVRAYTWGRAAREQSGAPDGAWRGGSSAGEPPAAAGCAGKRCVFDVGHGGPTLRGIGGLLAMRDGGTGEDYVVLYDANGNVGQLVAWAADYQGAAGNGWHADRLVARYEYDPYGNVIGPDTDADGDFDEFDQPGPYAAENPFRFSTKYYDGETDLYYYGYRHYSPGLGRWLNRDPIAAQGGVLQNGVAVSLNAHVVRKAETHLYAFVNNRPTSSVDSLGLYALLGPDAAERCCPREDILTDWKVCCSRVDPGVFGPLAALVVHCDLRQGACAQGEQSYDVWLSGSCKRSMDNGVPCGCATLDDARECLERNPYSSRPLGDSWGGGSECAGGQWGNNCQTSTIMQLGHCCLESNWVPHSYAGSPEVA